jgi:hypothetical protein
MPLGMLAGPIVGIEELGCRRTLPSKRTIVANVGPQPARPRAGYNFRLLIWWLRLLLFRLLADLLRPPSLALA